MGEVRLGINVLCPAKHQGSLADETGQFLWQGRKFQTFVTVGLLVSGDGVRCVPTLA